MSIPTPNLPNVWVCRLDGLLETTECANVLAFEDNGGTRSAEEVAADVEESLGNVLGTATGLSYQNVMSDEKVWTNLHVVRYDADDPDLHDLSLSGGEFRGNNTGSILPPQVAVCVTLRTAQAGRRARGRLYDYGLCEDSSTASGRLEGGSRTTIQDFWTAFGAEITTRGAFTHVVLSKGWVNEGTQDPRDSYAQNARPITSYVVRDVVFDTMRSRVS